MAADLPENYEARPDAFKFIRDVPADWGQTVALAGEVGDYVVIARRERGTGDWYVGAITDEEPRQVEVDLSFLDGDGRYNAEIYVDGADAHWESNPYSLSIEERPVTAADSLALQLAAGGGAAIRLARARRIGGRRVMPDHSLTGNAVKEHVRPFPACAACLSVER